MDIQEADIARHHIIDTKQKAFNYLVGIAQEHGTPGVNKEYEFIVKALAVNIAARDRKEFDVVGEKALNDRISKQTLLKEEFDNHRSDIEIAIPPLIMPIELELSHAT